MLKRLSVNVPKTLLNGIKELAQMRNINITSVVIWALIKHLHDNKQESRKNLISNNRWGIYELYRILTLYDIAPISSNEW